MHLRFGEITCNFLKLRLGQKRSNFLKLKNLDEITCNFFEIKARSKKRQFFFNLGLNHIRCNLLQLGLNEKRFICLIITNLVIINHYLCSHFTQKDITIQNIIDNHHCSI